MSRVTAGTTLLRDVTTDSLVGAITGACGLRHRQWVRPAALPLDVPARVTTASAAATGKAPALGQAPVLVVGVANR